MAASHLDQFVERYHRALSAFFTGDAEPAKALYSHTEDATLANPFGPVAVGWTQVAETMERAASNDSAGEMERVERVAAYATPDLAYLVEVERFRAKVGGREAIASMALRVTSVLRREDGAGGSSTGTRIPSPPLGRRNR